MKTYRSIIQLFSLLMLCFFFKNKANAQLGILLNTAEAMESYTLFENFEASYLIDNCGEVVHAWEVTQTNNHAKLLSNGNLIYMQGNAIQEMAWDGSIAKTTLITDDELYVQYEVIVLPNGNYLCVARRDFSVEQFLDIGYDFSNGTSPNVVDVVVEVVPESGEIVWEWNISDHVIQQRTELVPNYGVISESPELLNLDAITTYDWTFHESFMINGMDYNPALDQIALSVRKLSEVIIIDHSTTTAEAAGHTGGNAGKGGDILYRWGNPQNYDRGTEEDRMLYFQHNPQWIKFGPHTGKMTIYDNGLNRPDVLFNEQYSTIPVIEPPMNDNGDYILEDTLPYGPVAPFVRFSRVDTNTPFFSRYTSGAKYLPNGNIAVTEGQNGRLLEFNPSGEIVWTFTIPYHDYIFRSEKYPLDYEAFTDKDLTPIGNVSGTDSGYDCMLITNTDVVWEGNGLLATYYAATKNISISNENRSGFQYALYNLQGQHLIQAQTPLSSTEIELDDLPAGLYLLTLRDLKNQQMKTFKILIHE